MYVMYYIALSCTLYRTKQIKGMYHILGHVRVEEGTCMKGTFYVLLTCECPDELVVI